jgi:hypothetical protein
MFTIVKYIDDGILTCLPLQFKSSFIKQEKGGAGLQILYAGSTFVLNDKGSVEAKSAVLYRKHIALLCAAVL